MADQSLFYWQEKFGKTQPRILQFMWQITGAKTITTIPMGTPVLTTFDAIAAQSTIDNFLGTSSEFTIAQFDATAMGNDTFGCIINMGLPGQAGYAAALEISCYSGSGLTTEVRRASLGSGLTASTLETALGLGAYGNLAFKVDFGNTPDFDGLTAGLIYAKVYWISK